MLFFGLLAAFFSSPGQTFLVALFIPEMRKEFGWSQSTIAGVYSAATLVSALILPLWGRLLDRTRLAWFALCAGLLLVAGCVLLSRTQGILTVFLGFLLIRNLGQGTLTMVSSTTMARAFGAIRGKALGLSNLGYPLGEALLPAIVSAWIFTNGWRSGWLLLAGITLVAYVPWSFLLVRSEPHLKAQEEFQFSGIAGKPAMGQPGRGWTLKQIRNDTRFYLILGSQLVTPAFLTALFFHQASLMAWKAWDMRIVAMAFAFFGVCRGLCSLAVGPLIDRVGARCLYPFMLIPFLAGLFFLIFGRTVTWSFAYLACAGMTMGLGMTISGALWAELYGTETLGTIRGISSSVIVLATAVSPPIVGVLLDSAVDPLAILYGMALLTLLGMFLGWVGCASKPEPAVP